MGPQPLPDGQRALRSLIPQRWTIRADNHAELPARISEIGAAAADVERLLALVEDFHQIGLTRLVAMLQQWRGEIFLESVERDPVTAILLRSYDLPRSD